MKKGFGHHRRAPGFAKALVGLLLIATMTGVSAKDEIAPFAMPELTQTSAEAWLNSPPLTVHDLVGQVVLLDFWTFDCWNCYRSFPWLKRLEKRLAGKNVRVLGIHSPEFAHEQIRANLERKMKEYGLEHPVMMDNDFAFWTAMENRAWPAFYLIDKAGRVRYRFYGETHEGDAQAKALETAIERLLAEPVPTS